VSGMAALGIVLVAENRPQAIQVMRARRPGGTEWLAATCGVCRPRAIVLRPCCLCGCLAVVVSFLALSGRLLDRYALMRKLGHGAGLSERSRC
jgi:hypothetical protein